MAGYWKALSAAVGVAAFIGFAGSAQAANCSVIGDACTVTGVNVSFGVNGQAYTNVYYAGLIDYTITGVGDIFVVCDDPGNDVQVGNPNPPYTYYVENANNYLAGVTGGLNTIHEIAGLTFYALAMAGNAQQAGDAQMAIWDLINPAGGFNQNANIAYLETQGTWLYNYMTSLGFSYAELVSPTGTGQGCDPAQLTYTSTCQIQAQLFLQGGRGKIIILPEPGTLGLFGMALLALGGLGWMRSRRGFGIG